VEVTFKLLVIALHLVEQQVSVFNNASVDGTAGFVVETEPIALSGFT
jgi:hypothetical protein